MEENNVVGAIEANEALKNGNNPLPIKAMAAQAGVSVIAGVITAILVQAGTALYAKITVAIAQKKLEKKLKKAQEEAEKSE